jgi:hypothetical protein
MRSNRVAHHEPILNWTLRKHHDRMLTLMGWLAPAAAAWRTKLTRLNEVYRAEGIVLPKIVAAD